MRMAPTRMLVPQPALSKGTKPVAEVKHIPAPLKGLSLYSKLSEGEPMTATILRNFVIEDDRIVSRAGYVQQCAGTAAPIEHLIPWYGTIPTLCGAQAGTLIRLTDGVAFKTGFTGNDWDWTSFANLGAQKYTVMVNGVDGVWSWDGSVEPDVDGPVAVSGVTKANPAVVTLPAGNIGKFSIGQVVYLKPVAPPLPAGFEALAGPQVITAKAGDTFTVAVNTSSAAAALPAGQLTADPERGVVKELVTAPAGAAWVNPEQFQLVLAHMHRLWFADATNLAVFYLPVDQKSGTLEGMIPLNSVFKRGGYIKAMYTWTLEGGTGLNDLLVIFTSNGEAAIYSGIDPESDMHLDGVYRFDPPMSKHSVINYGGELYVLIPTGVVPMSTMLRAETEQLGKIDRNVISLFLNQAISTLNRKGWQLFLNPSTGRLFVNMPTGGVKQYRQLIRHMPRPVWSEFRDVHARCWGWVDPFVYFGDDQGRIFRMHPVLTSDNGQPIKLDLQGAWSKFGKDGIKQFKMLQPYLITDGDPYVAVEVALDYQTMETVDNEPDITFGMPGAVWDVSDWAYDDEPQSQGSYWAGDDNRAVSFWQGVKGKGRVGAPRLQARVQGCRLAIAGFDVTFETGAVVG